MFAKRFRTFFRGSMAAFFLVISASAMASEWRVNPSVGAVVPLSAKIDAPDPTYEVGIGVSRGRWGVSFLYTSGNGESDVGWITDGPGGEYDYFMAGLMIDYFMPIHDDSGWSVVVGSGPWFEHTEFTADPSGPPPTQVVLVAEESDTVVLCGNAGIDYRGETFVASVSLRGFLGTDNITTAAAFSLGVLF